MRRDLALVIALALAALVAALLPAPTWLSATLLLPLVLILPGYALAANFFAPRTVSRIERAVYVVTLSIAIVAVGGLLIQLVLGLSRGVWVAFLAATTIGAAWRALRRYPDRPLQWPAVVPWPLPVAGVAFLIAAVIAALAVVSAGDGLREAQAKIRFTDFWLVTTSAGALAPGEEQLEVGLRSHEGRPSRFGLRLSREGQVFFSRSLRLRAGESWERSFAVTDTPPDVPVVATLTRDGERYRRLDLVPQR
ncbi:MAG TPA: DUF1616 domain-containing protein [Solirubrobacterales bacterium]|nr:DUF1616 domain-containing protein [Solirubrobacterales bacterium]